MQIVVGRHTVAQGPRDACASSSTSASASASAVGGGAMAPRERLSYGPRFTEDFFRERLSREGTAMGWVLGMGTFGIVYAARDRRLVMVMAVQSS
jgi:hypothetical protein